MPESSGHTCPECGAPRGPDHTPSCACTARASEALRETRTAETAAAEDFDALRVRPYVGVGGPDGSAGPPEAEQEAPSTGASAVDGDRAGAPAAEAGAAAPGPGTRELPPSGDVGAEPFPAPAASATTGRARRRRTALLCVAGAGAVVAAVSLAGGLLSYQEPTRDRSAPEVRESLPEEAPVSPGSAFSPGPASPSAVRLPTSTPSAPGAAATAPASRGASRPAPSGTAPNSPSPTATPLALRRGDQGLEVVDLQARLSALNLYPDHIDGVYTRPVEDAVRTYQRARGVRGDTPGVYGAATRARLESETW
ncbi:peptidoglycan-binding domain-containing protein [Streptomyces cellostaticus]|uniref:peptidoglycan-binding domain-containing protein n=1 Tax=Streptomyces cellostaticus TaxID=67285 RepID=UPI002026A890|nr:peptidoglycan-binding domain-containing protein [Streptomyces cellostaticus]